MPLGTDARGAGVAEADRGFAVAIILSTLYPSRGERTSTMAGECCRVGRVVVAAAALCKVTNRKCQ